MPSLVGERQFGRHFRRQFGARVTASQKLSRDSGETILPQDIKMCRRALWQVMPENGNCLSDDQRQTMSWLVHEFEDLGLLDVPDQCPPGTRTCLRL